VIGRLRSCTTAVRMAEKSHTILS